VRGGVLPGAAARRWLATRLPVALIVTALLGGCVVGPKYVRPPVITPPTYKELDGWKMAEPGDADLRGPWWQRFGDPALDALEARVDVSNQNLMSAEATYRQASALVREARSAYFPTVTVGVGYARSRSSATLGSSASAGSTGATRNGGGTKSDFFQLPIDITWAPDFWGKVRRSVEASQAGAQASAADVQTARLSLQGELALDYFQLRTLDAQRRLLDATVAAFDRSLSLTRTRYIGGVASQVDVVQAQAQLDSARAQAFDVGVQRAQLEHAIALLVGQPPSSFAIPATPLSGGPPAIPVGVPSALLERRPDIAAAERRMASANAEIGVAIAAYYPTITLSASTGFESAGLATWLTWPSRFWSVGPGISETVFDGGLRRAQTEAARAAFDASVATYRQTVLGAFQSVEDNLAALRILEEEARVQEAAVQAAARSVTLTTEQYRAGTVGYLNVITTQTIALGNEITAVQLLGRRMIAAVQLVEALGGGWTERELPSAGDVTRRPDETHRP
jgi:NodT family efflux transporter outer membrane factor (OMF) lipoprotein